MVRDELSVLSAFLAVAEERSFTRAAKRIGVTRSPTYFESHPKPKSPRDLLNHRCINFRHGSDGVYRWEFDKGKQSLTVAVNGPLVVDDVELMVRAAIDGVGLAFVSDDRTTHHAASGHSFECWKIDDRSNPD